MGYRDDFWGGYAPSKPIKVEGGIKAKSKRGNIGDTWWSKRWVKVLESFGWSNRLERGRRYARSGQVLDFKLAPGRVTARVQGSMSEPYSVKIEMKPLADEAWNRVMEEMSQKAIFAAKLLADEMPQNIEEAFDAAGMSLFPESSKGIKTDCSCPDSANPCKHIAAVYYILAEEFDRDPFAAGRGRLIVAMAAIAAVIGAANSGFTGALVHLPAFALGWCAFAFTVYSIGTQAFPGQRGKDTFQRLVRGLALATTPALLVVLGVVPTYGPLFVLGAYIWVLLTATTAISAPLELNKDSSIIVATVGCMVLFTVSQIAPILIV